MLMLAIIYLGYFSHLGVNDEANPGHCYKQNAGNVDLNQGNNL
jgi:hypothetical protein